MLYYKPTNNFYATEHDFMMDKGIYDIETLKQSNELVEYTAKIPDGYCNTFHALEIAGGTADHINKTYTYGKTFNYTTIKWHSEVGNVFSLNSSHPNAVKTKIITALIDAVDTTWYIQGDELLPATLKSTVALFDKFIRERSELNKSILVKKEQHGTLEMLLWLVSGEAAGRITHGMERPDDRDLFVIEANALHDGATDAQVDALIAVAYGKYRYMIEHGKYQQGLQSKLLDQLHEYVGNDIWELIELMSKLLSEYDIHFSNQSSGS